jgi:carbon monoxide dehydrogenase subunit G
MRFEFSGAPEITAPRLQVWAKLMDPEFVAASGPGVESVEAIDPTHFKVVSGLGVGSLKIRFTLDVQLSELETGQQLKMRARGNAPGSAVDVLSQIQLEDVDAAKTRLRWSAACEMSGTVASIGARLLEGTARRLTEQFWTDFAQRVSVGTRKG